MKITVTDTNGSVREADVFSDAGCELMAELWTKVGVHMRLMYEPTWMGIPIIQFPSDIVMLQELVWRLRPDVIIETGVAHGGTAILYASIMEVLGKGKVVGVDLEIRQYNRIALQSHALARRIELIQGSSIDPATVDEVRRRITGAHRVMVALDSNHSYEHVMREMELYAPLVSEDAYLVVMDGLQDLIGDLPHAKPEWQADGPLRAIREWLTRYPQWEADPHYNRMRITCNPSGYLRRKSVAF